MKNKKGFTLVEIIVTMVLMSVVMIFLFNLLSDLRNEENKNNFNSSYVVTSSLLNEYLQSKFLDNTITSVTHNVISGVRTIRVNFTNTNYLNIIVSADNKVITIEEKASNEDMIDYEKRKLPVSNDNKSGMVKTISVITNSSGSAYTKKYLTTFKIVIADFNDYEYLIEAYYSSENNLGLNIILN